MNPYLIIGAIIFWIVSVTTAFFQGESREADRAKAEYAKQLDAAITEHNENALVDMQAAREAGEREARARVVTRTINNEVVRIIREKPSDAICRWDSDSFRLLGDAIKAASNLAPASIAVPDAGNTVKPASKP